jgi:hypothetical protein
MPIGLKTKANGIICGFNMLVAFLQPFTPWNIPNIDKKPFACFN